jgi:hypothetical protein
MNTPRMYPRMQVNVPVLCELADGELFAGMLVNVGLGGCKVECDRAPSSGVHVEMSTRLPGSSRSSQAAGVVRWSKDGAFGVSIGLLDASESALIAELATNPVRSAG